MTRAEFVHQLTKDVSDFHTHMGQKYPDVENLELEGWFEQFMSFLQCKVEDE